MISVSLKGALKALSRTGCKIRVRSIHAKARIQNRLPAPHAWCGGAGQVQGHPQRSDARGFIKSHFEPHSAKHWMRFFAAYFSTAPLMWSPGKGFSTPLLWASNVPVKAICWGSISSTRCSKKCAQKKSPTSSGQQHLAPKESKLGLKTSREECVTGEQNILEAVAVRVDAKPQT